MPIQPTTSINATTMAANWSAGLPANANKWLQKYLAPKALFNARPDLALANYVAAVTSPQVQQDYQSGFAKADPNQAATNATQFGINNYRAAGTSKAYKYARTTANLAAALTAVRATVEQTPRGPRGSSQNVQRATAQITGMAAYRGKIRP